MIWAIKDNERMKAIPKGKANCPLCNEELIAKCGEIKIWHWAHKSKNDCDDWYEPESEWHINWKNYFPKEWQEFKFEKHRADVYNQKKHLVIELQNSPISLSERIKREKFYRNIIWVLNGETLGKNLTISKRIKNIGYKYEWKWRPTAFFHTNKKLYVDLGDYLFLIINFSYGVLVNKNTFIIEHGGKI